VLAGSGIEPAPPARQADVLTTMPHSGLISEDRRFCAE